MTAIVAYNEALATAVDSIDAKAVAKQQAQTTSYIDVSVAATAAATKQVNIVLAQVGLVDMAVALPDNVKQVANEVAAGIDLKQSIETMVAQAQNNTFLTTKAQVAKTSIGANDANWTIDTNGNISLVRGDTNQKVTDTWQSVTQNDGQSVGWYKFDSNGNMQTGLVKDGEYLYYLKEEKGNTYGQMAKNETVVVGGLIMSFNNDGALVSMDYSYETVYEKVVNATIGEKQATNNVANETNILLSGLQAIVPNAPIIY